MRSSPKLVLFFLLLLTGLRLAYIGRVELTPDEAYYQMWSERLDWAYYSKGPGVAVAIRAGTALFGSNEFGVRFFSPWLALGTSVVLYGLARRLYGADTAGWAVLMLNVIPIFQAGSLLMTIDPPSIFFWSGAMAACWLALERRRVRMPFWLLAGGCVGLGFLCKYTNAMELVSIALAMALVPRWRREFRRPGFYALLLVAAVLGSPPVFWNATHAWITLNHLHDRGRLGAAYDKPLTEFVNFLGAHAGVYSPLVFIGIMIAIVWGCRQAGFGWRGPRRVPAEGYPATAPALEPTAEKARFLLAFGLPLLLMYTVLAFKTAGEPNWTAPAFISLSLLAAALWHARARTSRAAAAFCLAALAVGLVSSLVVVDTDLARQAGIPWPYDRDPTARLVGWRSVAGSVAAFRREEEQDLGAPVFLIANRYQLAAELNFYLPARPASPGGDPPVYLPESQNMETQFSFWPGYDQVADTPAPAFPGAAAPRPGTAEEEFRNVGASPFIGHSALFITDDERHRSVPDAVERGFEECALVAQYEIQRYGRPLRHVRIYACFNYRGLDL